MKVKIKTWKQMEEEFGLNKDLISEMKENKTVYGLLDHDRQAILNKAGCENSLYYRAVANIWGQVTGKKFCEGSVYRLKPDYQPKIEKCKSCTHTIKTPDGEITLQPVFHSIAWSVLFMGFGIKFNNTTSGESSCFVLDRDEATELRDALTTAIEIAGNGNGKEENK